MTYNVGVTGSLSRRGVYRFSTLIVFAFTAPLPLTLPVLWVR
jgi:hypothetical protein